MLLTTLLLLAGPTPTVKSTMDKFRAFVKAHPRLSVDVVINSSRGNGSGTLTLDRSPNRYATKAEWHDSVNGRKFDYVASGRTVLEVDHADMEYDRHPSGGVLYPGNRINPGPGFPGSLTMLMMPYDKNAAATKVSVNGGVTELNVTLQSVRGPVTYIADFGADGRLTSYKVVAAGLTEADGFQNYRLGADMLKLPYSVDPPTGFNAFAFDTPPGPIQSDNKIPLSGLPAKGKAFIVFVDDFIPAGLAEALKKMSAQLPVTVVSLQESQPELKGFKVIRATSAEFDAAGVEMTPQFYLVNDGKVVQGWQGFKAESADAFEKEVLTFQPGE